MNVPPGDTRVGWMAFFTWLARIGRANQDSGPTASRPTDGLWIGRRYYDTTLNKPVFVSSLNPAVWKDAAGTTV